MESAGVQWRFREGDTVYGSDGHKFGKVVGFFPDYTNQQFLIVEKGFIFSHDYYVPLSAVSNYDGNEIYLDVAKDEALNRGWDQAPLVTTPRDIDASIGS